MRKKHQLLLAMILLFGVPPFTPTAGASGLSLGAIFLGEPDVFVPGVGLSAELSIAHSLGLFAGGAYFLSGTWDLAAGVIWNTSSRLALNLEVLLLFDVIDGFIPQLGGGMRFSFPLSRSFAFFNELSVSVPLAERFLQPAYYVGFMLSL